MKKVKAFAILIVAVVMTFLTVMPNNVKNVTVKAAETGVEGQCGDKANYNYDPLNETLTIHGTGDMWDHVKWKKAIREGTKNIIIEDGITSIGSYSFDKFYNIEELKISDTVKTIKEYATNYVKGTLIIPASVTTVERYAIHADKVIIKGNMKNYQYGALGGCPAAEIEIGGSADTLGYALAGACEDDDFTVTISKDNKKCKLVKGCLLSANGKTLYYYIGKSKVSIPDTVRTIAPASFYKQYVQRVTLGKNVVTIGEYAFDQLASSEFKLTTNEKLKKIGINAFCSSLKKVTLKSNVAMEPLAFYSDTKIYMAKSFKKSRTVLSKAEMGKKKLKINFSKLAKAEGYHIRIKRGKTIYNYKTTKNEFSVVAPKALKKNYNIKFSYDAYNYEYLNKIEGAPAYVTVRPYKTSKNKKKIYGKWSSKMILTT